MASLLQEFHEIADFFCVEDSCNWWHSAWTMMREWRRHSVLRLQESSTCLFIPAKRYTWWHNLSFEVQWLPQMKWCKQWPSKRCHLNSNLPECVSQGVQPYTSSDAPIIGSAIGIGPIMGLSGQYRHQQILPITWTDKCACALQNHVLAFLLERCMRTSCGLVKLSWIVLLVSLP